jgi:hypothetical protein
MNKPCVQEARCMRLIPWTLRSGSEHLHCLLPDPVETSTEHAAASPTSPATTPQPPGQSCSRRALPWEGGGEPALCLGPTYRRTQEKDGAQCRVNVVTFKRKKYIKINIHEIAIPEDSVSL